LGHFAGDQLLKLIGPRLAPALAARGGELARLGGDEFAVVVRDARDGPTAEAVAADLVAALREPFAVGTLHLSIDASIGVALYPGHGRDTSALMRCADIAMYEAKRKHFSFALYSAADDRHSPRRLTLAHALGEAIRRGEIAVHYQPIIDLKKRRVCGVEALARWPRPEHGLVAPAEFIAIAETGDQVVRRWPAILRPRRLDRALDRKPCTRSRLAGGGRGGGDRGSAASPHGDGL
jgi:predicted signal transduction protein with EAL and GGDEF domain